MKQLLRNAAKAQGWIAAMAVALPIAVSAQMNNPLETDPGVWNSREMLVIWGAKDADENIEMHQTIYGVDFIDYLQGGSAPIQTRVERQTIPTSVLNPGVRPMAAEAGDMDGDGKDEVLYAVYESNRIKITAPPVSAVENEDSTFSVNLSLPATVLEVYTGVNQPHNADKGSPLLVSGDFDGDGQREFALAARNSDGEILVQLIDSDGSTTPELRAQSTAQTGVMDEQGAEVFDITVGDFDGDGDDEIALVYLKSNPSGSGMYAVRMRILDVTDEGCHTLVEKAEYTVDDASIVPVYNIQNSVATVRVGAASIKTELSGPDKIMVAFAFTPYDEESDTDNENFHLRLLEVDSDLESYTPLHETAAVAPFHFNTSLGLKTGDMNGSGMDDAVVKIGVDFRVYEVTPAGFVLRAVTSEVTTTDGFEQYDNDGFEVSDIDKNGRQNILYAYTQNNYPAPNDMSFYIKSVEFDTDYDPGTVLIKEVAFHNGVGMNEMYFALAPGNFDGDDLELGTPIIYECMYRRPMFILSPPPIHFDHIDGVNHDESGCFTGSDCLFSASNTITQGAASSLSYEKKNDWNVSGTVSAGFDGLYASVEASMTAKYGEQFSNENTSAETETIELHHTVTIDDFIKGVQYPVKVYEYPVYNAAGELINYVSAAFPVYEEAESYEQQGKIDPFYTPYYEPGNLLSYPPIGNIEDFPDFIPGSKIYEGPAYTMSNNPGQYSTADISHENVYGESGSVSWESGAEIGMSVSGFGMGFETNGAYNEGATQINSTEMSGSEGFSIRYDNILGPSGFFAYTVKPYIYSTPDGAGRLAYQVDIHSSESSPTWWDLNYGQKPDPALMLPQRNEVYWTQGADPDTPIFTRSKSMTFSRLYPSVGDEVTVQCRVHNFSLKETSGPVKVSFYNGNPDMGGELVQSLDGQTIFETSGAIPARGRAVVEMTFAMPLPVVAGESFVRFYAVVDPLNELDEIHEDNNKGWQTLGYDCENGTAPTGVNDYFNREHLTGMWAWPNPATDHLNLAFHMGSSQAAVMEIYDMEGRRVAQENLGVLPAGAQEVGINLPDVSPGIYFVQIISRDFRKTQKFMIR